MALARTGDEWKEKKTPSNSNSPMGLRGDHNHTGGGRMAQNILEELDKVEVSQVIDLEGGLQAILCEAPG